MAIDDIKGYKPHTDKKVETVNRIKDAENALGAILEDIEQRLSNSDIDSLIEEELDEVLERIHQIQLAKDRLKEASMWACRAVFQPDEKY
ncbi:hypothetical protein BL02_84 [Klebsiella phage BL02]|jgi:ferritin-like metal-binding protein YciE|uniref:Phage protein n=5 Tax=Slopekvirus TaxID=1985328 RepID=A0A1G4GQ53_9CAUD|nr:hypothetical protein KP27_095 [Klebsiella phage KP27]YP_009194328.1 hypothetical protein CPT_Matisse84 [Klebsiella phage Matisse]YP_009607280.1 hypothetical protein FDI06_gp273 [Klebsiella phage Miro]YP_009626320.1 Phage protein [Klebsiella phage PMBT1]YP_010089006.1 hypothetical protein KNT56_gp253 [Escherichia phage phT4A]MBG2194796.1 hypothetical protein [Klebsiella pneumoniae]QYC51214.1 hypothetical protein [Klebsiella phage vB_KpnM-VAC66]UJP30508.1 hypothetical protein phKl59_151 [Ra